MISSPDAFEAAIRARLTLDVPALVSDPRRGPGDHLLDPGQHEAADILNAKPAAVLIPVVQRPDPAIILTQRSADLSKHAGQIAFPGGRIDKEDGSPLEAALREAEEEIGLHRALVQPLGYLDPYLTRTGYHVVPVVAMVRPDYALRLNPSEVDEAFEVPLSFLMNEANHERHSRLWQGKERHYLVMPYQERYIWGVTAGILRNLYERLHT